MRETAAQDPRSRLLNAGAAALNDAELVGVLVGCLEIANDLLARFAGLETLARATPPELVAIRGIGPAGAARLLAAVGLAARLYRRRAAAAKLDEASRIADLLTPKVRLLPQETTHAALRHELSRDLHKRTNITSSRLWISGFPRSFDHLHPSMFKIINTIHAHH